MFLPKSQILLCIIVLFSETLCVCEKSHIIICDDFYDIRIREKESETWRYVQVGSSEFTISKAYKKLDVDTVRLPAVKSLTIINRIKRIVAPIRALDGPPLEYLNFYDNRIKLIEADTFIGLANLKEVYLENNRIRKLGRAAFRGINLEIVSLSRNQIDEIGPCFLDSNIKWILLNDNRISSIRPSAFPNNLERLELNNNLLKHINDLAFDGLSNLKELFLENNRLLSIPLIASLTNVRYLHFAYNNISRVDWDFTNRHQQLTYLDLSSNLITNISVDIFASNMAPTVLLSFNRLVNLNFNPERTTDLMLYGNPWNCDCLFKLEKKMADFAHDKTCYWDLYENGHLPMCVENGRCEENLVSDSDIENYMKSIEGSDRSFCKMHF